MTTSPELRRVLAAGLAELGLAPGTERIEVLARLCERVAQWSERIDLTGHRGPEAIARRLVLDAAALSRELPVGPDLADLGSGAGFPGLPIAVLQPERHLTLVEARERRHHFQRAAVRELGIANVSLRHGRSDRLPPEPHTAVVAQALGRPANALRQMRDWCAEGGWLLLPGGERAPDPPVPEGVFFVRTVSYRVPAAGPARTLWIGRRQKLPG